MKDRLLKKDTSCIPVTEKSSGHIQLLTINYTRHAVTRHYLEKFLKEKRNTTDIRINDIDYRFIIDFETFLRNHKPIDYQKPLNNNGVMKHLIRLRKMTTLALKLTWVPKDPFKNYKFRYKKVETAFLNQSINQTELNAIHNKQFIGLISGRHNISTALFIFF